MRPVNSILIVLSREGDPSKVIQRGVRLARCFKAHIELFLCEAECAYVLEHQYHAGAAALDVSGADSPELIRTILLAAEGITEACGASLELVYAMRPEGARSDAPLRSARDLLTDRAAAVEVHPREAHVLIGEPVSAISEFVAEHSCDFVVLGALTHRDSMTALVGTLT